MIFFIAFLLLLSFLSAGGREKLGSKLGEMFCGKDHFFAPDVLRGEFPETYSVSTL
jgi:hypothetical protein